VVAVEDCPVSDPGIRAALGTGRLRGPAERGEKDRFTVYSRGTTFLSELGERRGRVSLGGRDIRLDAGVFFQSNGDLLEALAERLVFLAAGADRSLPLADLYAGVGTFAVFLRELFPRADLVEENPAALALARENIPLKNAAFYALSADAWAENRGISRGPYGFMVLDPPRTGLSPGIRGWIRRNGPALAAFVSCDPATLARDGGELAAGGYALTELELYDFYPQTAHIETLAVFRKDGGGK
jgi:23S rRNA (uracil1939-C5)-methyltransferase